MDPSPQPQLGSDFYVPPNEIKRLRIGHRHKFYALNNHSGQVVLVVCVAQESVKPCTWAVSYTADHAGDPVLIQRIGFDANDLRQFREAYAKRSLSWLDTEFMLRISLDRAVRAAVQSNLVASQSPQPLSLSDLHLLRINGCLPQVERLLEVSSEHVLLHRDLCQVKELPPLIES